MTLTKLNHYFQQNHQLIDNSTYYRNLSIAIGVVLTIFVYIFDPYDNYQAVPKYEIPIKIIQLGYGINTTLVIYALYWLLFRKLGFANGKRVWKTYHHCLLLIVILCVAGFLGTVYHRFMMDVGEVDPNYYLFVTIPRSIIIAIPLFIITILLDRLYMFKNTTQSIQQHAKRKEKTSNKKIKLKSPVINQTIEIIPENIEYIKASGNYVEIYTTNDEKPQLIRASLRYISECLSTYDFIVKCHRQYYINTQKIRKYQRNSQRIFLSLDTTQVQIPVSKNYVKKLLYYLKKDEK